MKWVPFYQFRVRVVGPHLAAAIPFPAVSSSLPLSSPLHSFFIIESNQRKKRSFLSNKAFHFLLLDNPFCFLLWRRRRRRKEEDRNPSVISTKKSAHWYFAWNWVFVDGLKIFGSRSRRNCWKSRQNFWIGCLSVVLKIYSFLNLFLSFVDEKMWEKQLFFSFFLSILVWILGNSKIVA